MKNKISVSTIELLEDDLSIGYAPIVTVHETGNRQKIMLHDGGKPMVFKTSKEALEKGKEFKEGYNSVK